MPAPTVTFTVQSFTFGQIFTSTQANALQDNGEFVKQWLGDTFVNSAIQDHNHDGLNSAGVTVASSSVNQGGLRTTTGEVSTASVGGVNLTLAGGEYGFYPQVRRTTAGNVTAQIASTLGNSLYSTNIFLSASAGVTVFAKQRFIQASPPHKLGSANWGHFLFLLRNSTGEIKSSYECEDPPWANNGALYLPKNDFGRITAVPHPFADYWGKDPAAEGLEVTLIDLREYDVRKWKFDNAKVGKGILEDLAGKVSPGKIKAHKDFKLPQIPGFTNRVKIRGRT